MEEIAPDSSRFPRVAALNPASSMRRRGLSMMLSMGLVLLAVVAIAALVSDNGRTVLAAEDPKQEASEKLHEWWNEVKDMQNKVQKFQEDATEKSVEELVHLARVKDLLETLQTQVPVYSPPAPTLSWDYSKGPNGPANWGSLSPDFALCGNGKSQSPINIELDLQAAELPSLAWQLPGGTALRVRANRGGSVIPGRELYDGHTFEVEEIGGPYMTVAGVDYVLQEFHFHTPSEHSVAGRHYDAEVQFVHVASPPATSDGQPAPESWLIVSAFFQQGDRSPAFLEQLVTEAIPNATARPQELVDLHYESISQTILVGTVPSRPEAAKEFVPNFKNYFQYTGSLSTPPCTEGVTWVLFKNPIAVSPADLAALSALEGTNIRPIQPLNGRQILDMGGNTP